MKETEQMKIWSGDFGKEYTDRNPHTIKELDAIYKARYGVTRTEMNKEFLGDLRRDTEILEVGCNVGVQLQGLWDMGFPDLWGIELQPYAIKLAQDLIPEAEIIKGSVLDIPYRDNRFDLVFTSGLLIHIAPEDIKQAIDEIYRCSRKYIWGFEYFSDKCEVISYRGYTDLLWKNNYVGEFLKYHSDLEVEKMKFYQYIGSENKDVMFLLRK